MTTRRDLLKIASALGLAGAAPTLAERIDVAKLLDESGPERIVLNPGEFAVEVHQSVGNGEELCNDWYGVICPEWHAEYKRARHRLEGVLKDHGINSYQEAGDYDAAATAMYLAMYDAGLRHGAAYESLRRSLVGETVECTKCWGTGVDRRADATCRTCGGTGTVALKDGAR